MPLHYVALFLVFSIASSAFGIELATPQELDNITGRFNDKTYCLPYGSSLQCSTGGFGDQGCREETRLDGAYNGVFCYGYFHSGAFGQCYKITLGPSNHDSCAPSNLDSDKCGISPGGWCVQYDQGDCVTNDSLVTLPTGGYIVVSIGCSCNNYMTAWAGSRAYCSNGSNYHPE